MDADRVRSYLQVACAGLGFDIGEVWWMSNESGTSTVATIEERAGYPSDGHESDSSGEGTYTNLMSKPRKRGPKKRFLQLYTSKAYCNQRSKLVQPNSEQRDESPETSSPKGSATMIRHKSSSNLSNDEDHVLSPRIVEAVTVSAQVVWANCQKREGLLGRSDIKLQTAIGMPVGVDDTGNVWVVVMFSPKNVQSSSDAIDYLQYISKSAACSSIPCLLPVIHPPKPPTDPSHSKMIMHSRGPNNLKLVSAKPKAKPTDSTKELGDGVTARFVSFRLSDDDDNFRNTGAVASSDSPNINDLRNAPKDDFGIPMLPASAQLNGQVDGNPGNSEQLGGGMTDAFDEASYGVWSTIMNSVGGSSVASRDAITAKMHLIEEHLEEFASAFLGMSVFDVADAWMPSTTEGVPKLKCLFTTAATGTNPGINLFREVSANVLISNGSGAVGKAFSSGYPVWSSNKEVIFDENRKEVLLHCKIETAFAVPIFAAGDVSPSCVLCCYSLLPTESVPFVLNFVQKAVRLLWDGLDRVDPHESVGKELWKDVAPADLGEMAADLEMQKAFIGKKRPHSDLSPGTSNEIRQSQVPRSEPPNQLPEQNSHRFRSSSLAVQMESLPGSSPPDNQSVPNNAPPLKGLGPAPLLPTTVQMRPHLSPQYRFLNSGNDGHWAVQQAVRSVGNVVLWENNINQPSPINGTMLNSSDPSSAFNTSPNTVQEYPSTIAYQQQQQQQQHYNPSCHVPLSYVNHGGPAWTGQSLTTPMQPHPQGHQPSPPVVHADDPAVIRANIMEFNAMAQRHNPSPMPGAPDPNSFASQPVVSNVHIDKLVVIPLSHAGGSILLGAPQQNIYQTTSQPVNACLPIGSDSFPIPVVGEGKECRIMGCKDISVAKRPYCLRHCGNRQCEWEGCTKCAQGATRFCIAHGGGRRCTFPGCDKGARDKYFCAAHGGGKRCKHDGCSKSAVGGSSFCTSHGGGRRCQVEGCDKSAQSSTLFCVKHGGGKKCQQQGCEKVARGRTMYCAAHGGGVRCKLEGCNRVAIGKAQLCRSHGGGSSSRMKNETLFGQGPV